MQVYVRLGIRLSYKGATSRKEGGRGLLFSLVSYLISLLFVARRLLKSLSIKQGIKYDAPESAADIAPFIAFHGLLHLLYKLMGNLEPSRSVPQVTTTTEDWPWFQLAMVS
jgi:hypothetical protein